ncbi:MAG: prepilin peptidase, partial [Desulfitobacterium hafniense]|nr:prepilin peptidase [Desulfitobacterium hafniense]
MLDVSEFDPWALSLVIGSLGLLIGSFLNVVIHRVPRGESIVSPASHCPECGHFLRPWELIPVLSFFVLRARCGKCGNKISWRYPMVELLTAVLFFYTA